MPIKLDDKHEYDYRSPDDKHEYDYRSPNDFDVDNYRSPNDFDVDNYRSPNDYEYDDDNDCGESVPIAVGYSQHINRLIKQRSNKTAARIRRDIRFRSSMGRW